MIEKKEKRAHTVTSPRLNLFINYFKSFIMEKITIDVNQEILNAGKGGIASAKHAGSTVTMSLVSQWFRKDADGNPTNESRTKNGSLGATTSEGWLNLSALIKFLNSVQGEVKNKLMPTEQVTETVNGITTTSLKTSIVFNPTYMFKISFNKEGGITKVEE